MDIDVMVADESHDIYVDTILETINAAAKVRGSGIAKRTHEYLSQKMKEGKAIIAITDDKKMAGFCYIESWGNKTYVANSGLIVAKEYRGHGLAKRIKKAAFLLSRLRWPKAKLFGLTSGAAVMKINTELGYLPVTFDQLTDDDAFWHGCEGCVNHDVLLRTNRKYCICTAMLFDPNKINGDKVRTPSQVTNDLAQELGVPAPIKLVKRDSNQIPELKLSKEKI